MTGMYNPDKFTYVILTDINENIEMGHELHYR